MAAARKRVRPPRTKGPSVVTSDGRVVHLKRPVKVGPGFSQHLELVVQSLLPALDERIQQSFDRIEKVTDRLGERLERLECPPSPDNRKVPNITIQRNDMRPDDFEIVERTEGLAELLKLAWLLVEQADNLDALVIRSRVALEGEIEPEELTPHHNPGAGQLRTLHNALLRTQAFIGRATNTARRLDNLTRDTGPQASGEGMGSAKVSR